MAREKKSLHFNLQEGENVVFHREHRSKRGRSRMNRDNRDIFYKKRKQREEEIQGVDKKSLRDLKNRYKI